MGSAQQLYPAVFQYVALLLGFLFPGHFPTDSKLKPFSFLPGKETSTIQVCFQLSCAKDHVGKFWTCFWKCAGLPRIQKARFLSRLFHHLSSQILGCSGALCGVGSDNWPGLPVTARESRTLNPILEGNQVILLICQHSKGCRGKKENSEYLLPSGLLHCSQGTSGCDHISYGGILENLGMCTW